jgi:hypothetical protein
MRVAEIVQAIDELTLGERLPAAQLERPRENAREDGLVLAVKPCVDEVGEADVRVGGEETDENAWNRERERGEAHPTLAPQSGDANSQQSCGRVGASRRVGVLAWHVSLGRIGRAGWRM